MKQEKSKIGFFETVKSISQNAINAVADVASDIAEGACNIASDIAEGTTNIASNIADGARDIASDIAEGTCNIASDIAEGTRDIVTDIAEGARDIAVSTVDKVNAAIDEKKAAAEKELKDKFDAAILPLEGTETETFIRALGDSPLILTDSKSKQIKRVFPVPREQNILWADAEFDLRPSGIAATDKGLFIRTNVDVLDGIFGSGDTKPDTFETEEEKQAYLQHKSQYHSGRAVLLFYSWNDFDAGWFVSESEIENKALLVEPQCNKRFVESCRAFIAQAAVDNSVTVDIDKTLSHLDEQVIKTSSAVGAGVESSQIAVFAEQKAAVNTPAGHGEMAEEAINMIDRLHGLDAKVIGRDNAKNGPDRQIGDVFIQTKYYKTARGSLEACFDSDTKLYKYMKNDKPMQLEVPKDQYQSVLDGFRKKIENGEVPGVTDPNEAVNIVRKGRLTYQQAVNLTKPGTIESLSFDALTGAVTCTCTFGITFVFTVFLTWRKTGAIKEAVQAGVSAGLQVFGISFIQHMLVSQLSRTALANAFSAPSRYIVAKLGYKASATIVNAIRALSGKSAIFGIAASKHLAKILRSNALTSVLSLAIFSIPETYNVASRKISGAQYAKNMSVLTGSVVGAVGGSVAAGAVAAKIAGIAGTAVIPVVGTVVGVAGGFVGGALGAQVIKATGDFLYEDDAETFGRLFNAYVSYMIGEYLLDETEIDCLIARLDEIKPKEFKELFENLEKADEQECLVRDFLNPHFEAVIAQRTQFMLPSPDCIVEALAELVVENADVQSDSL